ncbi:MAG: LysM peptidoglycan-binding domain-containing protein [Bacteroidales bacterium]|nr:LysM peptidoglycan-binding domain-containing protein [Bacteroidales bacterium]MBR4647158.1 LysM peptidoglycan-binding domain-containing protein [Bacteroidales bacterium]
MRLKILICTLLYGFVWGLNAQPESQNASDSTAAKSTQESLEIFTRNEIRLMDSLLNVWYVKRDLASQNSVLSKLTDDTTKYDNNDSLIYKRLSAIETPIQVAYNDKVKRFIELYSVQRQRSSSVILGLAQYYYPWMKAIFDKYDLPEELVYITIIESALNPTAVSPAGATGIWQFMYGTGKLYGLEVTSYVDDRRDPYKATDAAARHFRDLYNIFGDWGLAISAYNCGAGNVRKAIQRSGGKTDFWSVCNYLPRETQNYFPAFIGAMYMMTYHNLYGIQPAKISIPLDVDTIMIQKETHFQQIANVLGVSYDEIKSLNPQYKKDIIPAFNLPMPVRLRSNDILRYIAMADSVPNYNYDTYFNPTKNLNLVASNGDVSDDGMMIVQKTPNKYHIVKKGETLGKIASKYHTSVNSLKALNHLHSTNLRIGQKLIVKKGSTVKVPNPNYKPSTQDSTKTIASNTTVDSMTTKSDTVGSPAPVQPKPEIKPVQQQLNYTSYTIRQGDTLSSIARRYGTTANDIAQYNHLANKDAIKIGQKLKIPKK